MSAPNQASEDAWARTLAFASFLDALLIAGCVAVVAGWLAVLCGMLYVAVRVAS